MHHEIRNVRPRGPFWASSIGLRSGLRASTSLVQASLRVLKLFGLVHFEHQEISLFDSNTEKTLGFTVAWPLTTNTTWTK